MQARFCRRKMEIRTMLEQQKTDCNRILEKFHHFFMEEEVMMVCSGYPDYDTQSIAHRRFIRELRNHAGQPGWLLIASKWMCQHDFLYDRHFLNWLADMEKSSRYSAGKNREIQRLISIHPEYIVLPMRFAGFHR